MEGSSGVSKLYRGESNRTASPVVSPRGAGNGSSAAGSGTSQLRHSPRTSSMTSPRGSAALRGSPATGVPAGVSSPRAASPPRGGGLSGSGHRGGAASDLTPTPASGAAGERTGSILDLRRPSAGSAGAGRGGGGGGSATGAAASSAGHGSAGPPSRALEAQVQQDDFEPFSLSPSSSPPVSPTSGGRTTAAGDEVLPARSVTPAPDEHGNGLPASSAAAGFSPDIAADECNRTPEVLAVPIRASSSSSSDDKRRQYRLLGRSFASAAQTLQHHLLMCLKLLGMMLEQFIDRHRGSAQPGRSPKTAFRLTAVSQPSPRLPPTALGADVEPPGLAWRVPPALEGGLGKDLDAEAALRLLRNMDKCGNQFLLFVAMLDAMLRGALSLTQRAQTRCFDELPETAGCQQDEYISFDGTLTTVYEDEDFETKRRRSEVPQELGVSLEDHRRLRAEYERMHVSITGLQQQLNEESSHVMELEETRSELRAELEQMRSDGSTGRRENTEVDDSSEEEDGPVRGRMVDLDGLGVTAERRSAGGVFLSEAELKKLNENMRRLTGEAKDLRASSTAAKSRAEESSSKLGTWEQQRADILAALRSLPSSVLQSCGDGVELSEDNLVDNVRKLLLQRRPRQRQSGRPAPPAAQPPPVRPSSAGIATGSAIGPSRTRTNAGGPERGRTMIPGAQRGRRGGPPSGIASAATTATASSSGSKGAPEAEGKFRELSARFVEVQRQYRDLVTENRRLREVVIGASKLPTPAQPPSSGSRSEASIPTISAASATTTAASPPSSSPQISGGGDSLVMSAAQHIDYAERGRSQSSASSRTGYSGGVSSPEPSLSSVRGQSIESVSQTPTDRSHDSWSADEFHPAEGYSLHGLEADTAALWSHAAQMHPGFASQSESPARKGREQDVPPGLAPSMRMRVSSPMAAATAIDGRRPTRAGGVAGPSSQPGTLSGSDGLATVPEAGRLRGGTPTTPGHGLVRNPVVAGNRGSRESLHHAPGNGGRDTTPVQGPSPPRRPQERFVICGSQSHHFAAKDRRRTGPRLGQQSGGGATGQQPSAPGLVAKVMPAGASPGRVPRGTGSSTNSNETPREAKQAENVNNLVSIFRGSRFQDIDQQPAPEPLPEAGVASPPAASVGNAPNSTPPANPMGGSASAQARSGSMTLGSAPGMVGTASMPVLPTPQRWSERGRSCDAGEDSGQSDTSPDRFRHVTVPSNPALSAAPASPKPDIHRIVAPSRSFPGSSASTGQIAVVQGLPAGTVVTSDLLRGKLHSATSSTSSLASVARTPSPALERQAHSASARCLRIAEPRSASVSHSPGPISSRSAGPAVTATARRAASPTLMAAQSPQQPPMHTGVQPPAIIAAAVAGSASRNSRATWPTPAMHAQLTRNPAAVGVQAPNTSPRAPSHLMPQGVRRR